MDKTIQAYAAEVGVSFEDLNTFSKTMYSKEDRRAIVKEMKNKLKRLRLQKQLGEEAIKFEEDVRPLIQRMQAQNTKASLMWAQDMKRQHPQVGPSIGPSIGSAHEEQRSYDVEKEKHRVLHQKVMRELIENLAKRFAHMKKISHKIDKVERKDLPDTHPHRVAQMAQIEAV